MRKIKGFTLIELLAVIVILAIIALSATPMIMDVIEKSRRQSAIESVNGLLDAGDKYQLESIIDNKEYSTTIDLTSDILKHKGAKPESGTLVIADKGRMSIIAKYGAYCIVKTFDEKSPHVVDRDPCVMSDSELVDIPDYIEPLLNGADPVLKSSASRTSDTTNQGLIPITIENDGTVKRANLKKDWYKYEEKRWANAVILKDESITYEAEEIIPEENIEKSIFSFS